MFDTIIHKHYHQAEVNINTPDPFCSCDHRHSLHFPKCSKQNCNCLGFVSAGQTNVIPKLTEVAG